MPDAPSALFVVSECAPYAKAGGLGDVAAALPAALRRRGHDARVVMPCYDFIPTAGMRRHEAPLAVPFGASEAWCAVREGTLPGTDVPVYFLERDDLFARGYVYDPPGGSAGDNLLRFAFLSRGAFALGRHLGWIPDVLHAHDWPTALVPLYLNTVEAHGDFARTASVLTIHNLAHQAKFPARDLGPTQLPWELFHPHALEDHGALNPLKGGAFHATMLTTVSPRYAQEIRTPEGGAGLDHVLRFRGADLVGILNGIDARQWNPETDPLLPARYTTLDLTGKALCKAALQRDAQLAVDPALPLLGMVTRLTDQKGTDVVLAALDRLLALDLQMVVLGAGDPSQEHQLLHRSHHGGERFRAYVGFDESLAHRIEAGADLFLMPSRFEPCGLNQMYSQRYGTLPIVRATGGLDDTVDNFDPVTGEGTGFKLWHLSADSLVDTVAWAVDTWRSRPADFHAMQVRAMRRHFDWDLAASRYADVYAWALERRRA